MKNTTAKSTNTLDPDSKRSTCQSTIPFTGENFKIKKMVMLVLLKQSQT